ncbi:MAG: TonB-dependent receptor, partial [Novosphingobium sp.]|nr:TonB-dependent receptor [Novosphingobium sp.]
VVRLQRVNVVFHRTSSARELTQELRIRSTGERRFAWQVGATVFWSREASTLAFGAQRGALAGSELLSSPVLSDLQRVGPPAALNVALVDNPAARQILFNDSTEARRTIALFATADYRLTQALRLRAELRATWERLTLDSRTANFLPSFGTSLGAQHFHDITPRFSLDWRLNADLLVFASYAKGTRSGGINAIPNLRADEQTYAPESNWTAEIGAKYVGGGLVRSAQLTAYDIDWRDTQIRAVSATPGFPSLIFSNTSGIRTRGVEAAAQIVPAGWLALDLAWSYTDPRFKAGSEDPGFAGSCGLSVVNSVSSFCTIRPSTISPGQLVPDISGNLVSRVARTSWSAALTLAPPLAHFRSMRLHVDVTHQGNEYDQNIDGLYFGARTLLGARLSIPLGHFVAELWGTNLTDARYVRDAATRQPGFYATVPRPTDLILADRRRVGLTLRFPG